MIILPTSWAAIQGLWAVHHMIAVRAAFGICPEQWKPEAFPRLRLMPREGVSQDGGSSVKTTVSSRLKSYVGIGYELQQGGVMACRQGREHATRSEGRRRERAIRRGGSRQEAAAPVGC
jgi:hypothetical protein